MGQTNLPAENKLIAQCLGALGASVHAELVEAPRGNKSADGQLRLTLGHCGKALFLVDVTRTHLSRALVAGRTAHMKALGGNWVLFAPYVPSKSAQYLIEQGVGYVDSVGNCHLQAIKGDLLIHIEGKKPERHVAKQAGGRVESYQLLFAILAKPELLNAPVRQIAVEAGIGKTAVAFQLARLVQQGLLARTRTKISILRRKELTDRWLSAYSDVVRPGWLVGRYRTQTGDPAALESQIEKALAHRRWAFGGGAAAWRTTRFYRGPETILHISDTLGDLPRQLRAIPAEDGPLTILRTPGNVAYTGTSSNVAHPLLVYTELATSLDPRSIEAADEIRQKYLAEGQ